MTRRVVVAALAMALGSGCTRPGCYEETVGEIYECTCTRRCNGVNDSYSRAVGCQSTRTAAASSAQSNCGNSCTPSAVCASCTCESTGEECLSETCPRY
jgi:hypothetical protein